LRYGVEITPVALEMLKGMKDRSIARQIAQRIDRLGDDPEKQGKPLLGGLRGYRSVRAAGQRYRVIYGIQDTSVIVIVAGVGIRKEGERGDIHKLVRKMIQLNLIEPSSET
jgi:mRNA interferase RelE/StbE